MARYDNIDKKVNRHHPVEVITKLFIDAEALSTHLARMVHESPRVGDLGGGQGLLSSFLNQKGVETINIDPGTAPYDEAHHIQDEYGQAHFTHKPHLIIAHQSVVSLDDSHPMRYCYSDFNTAAKAIVQDADPRVGTVVMDASWTVEKPIDEGLEVLDRAGFHLISPRIPPRVGNRISMALSRVEGLNIDKFRTRK